MYIHIYIYICPPWYSILLGSLEHQTWLGPCGYLRVLAALPSQLLLCRTLSCGCGVHPTLTNVQFLRLGDFVSWVSDVAALRILVISLRNIGCS